MSCSIKKSGNIILTTSAGVLGSIYDEIMQILYEKNLTPNSQVDLFLEKLEECSFTLGGTPIDITNIFTKSKNIEQLLDVFTPAINRIKSKLINSVFEDLIKLNLELINYKEELESQGK